MVIKVLPTKGMKRSNNSNNSVSNKECEKIKIFPIKKRITVTCPMGFLYSVIRIWREQYMRIFMSPYSSELSPSDIPGLYSLVLLINGKGFIKWALFGS